MYDQDWLILDIGFPVDMAKKIFVKKYGKQPATWKFENGRLLVVQEPRVTFANVGGHGQDVAIEDLEAA